MAIECTYSSVYNKCRHDMSKVPTYKELYESRHEPENLRPLAEVYWRAILIAEVCVLAAALGLVMWAYSVVHSNLETANQAGQAQASPISVDKIDAALDLISKREAALGATPAQSIPAESPR